MTVIDLTQTIREGMPVYPGTESPVLAPANSFEKDGFRETLLKMTSHTGTHMDSPAHLFANGSSLDDLDVSRFIGKALVLDCSDVPEGGEISYSYVEKVQEEADKAEFLLFMTKWDRYWNTEHYFGAYPVICQKICRYMAETGKKGVGFDTIGADPISEPLLPRHKILLSAQMVIVENLCNLEKIGNGPFTFAALPLKFAGSDGSPVRSVAILDYT